MQGKKLKIVFLWLVLVASISCSGHKYQLLLSWESYVHQSRKDPYILELEHRNCSLVYYGAFHRIDVENPQFEDIEQRWEEFQPTVALSEGTIWPLEKSRTEAIRKYGEQGLLRFLADRDNIPIKCIDPPRGKQAPYLNKYFPASQIKIYFVLLQAAVNRMLGKDMNDLSYVDPLLRRFGKISGFDRSPRNLSHFEHYVSKIFPELKPWQWIPFSYFRNEKSGKFLARIHRKVIEFRNRYQLNTLIDELNKGQRVFAVVGRSHVVMQEPVLRSLRE